MNIRNFQAGDEAAQVAIYNTAGAPLPKFKPTTLQEVQRRTRVRNFDQASRFYAIEGGKTVGYCNFNPNGRVSFPWCLPGHEACAEPLFTAALAAMKQRGLSTAFAAYRGDWPQVHDFFLKQGFQRVRDMLNFIIDLLDMPTPSSMPSTSITPLEVKDVPDVYALAPQMLRCKDAHALQQHLFHNPFFPSTSLFALRGRDTGRVVAAGVLVTEATYANPKALDAMMPCYRLGAFGTETMNWKRINGMFSFLARPDNSLPALALDLMGHAAYRLRDTDDLDTLAAQVASDQPAFVRFYDRNFRRQGSFPEFELKL